MDDQKKAVSEAVGARIRFIRNTKSMSQEELALRANLNPAYYGQVERGLKCPTLDTLCKIASALEVHPVELLQTDALTEAAVSHTVRMQELLSRVPPDKINQLFKILEDIVEAL